MVATVLAVPPLIGHGRGDPHGRGTQALDVVKPFLHPCQITAAVMRFFLRVELPRALVVVVGVAVFKPIGHQEINDLISPIRRRHVQLQSGPGCC